MPTSVQEQVKVLVELQKIDGELFRLRKVLAEHPARQKKAEEEFEKKKVRLKAAEDELKSRQVKQKDKELDLQSREEKIKKLQTQLYALKSNKEYQAMELEIKGAKADNSLVEEEILRLFDAVEEARTAVAREKEALAVEEKAHRDTLAVLKKDAETLGAQVSALEEKRKAYTPNLEPKLLTQYEKILKGRDGTAIVPILEQSCGGCHIGLPPQFINEIQMNPDKLMYCEDCGRILYWPS
ncbi:MAG: hypothetical protein MOGMAGMI_01249 [Candidatus Omnitrophica bacterium]|nr:hypothetical protein [Candidatus Omnitrophota bacterium]